MPEILEFDKMFYRNFEPKMGNRFIMEINGIEEIIADKVNINVANTLPLVP